MTFVSTAAKVILTGLLFLLPGIFPSAAQAGPISTSDLAFPTDESLKYPFTKDDSLRCGRWEADHQDYPYFGAPRNRNSRKHAGIDIYPVGGEGTPVKAIKDGLVIKVAPFFIRSNGEKTYSVLIDHGDFVANYAELKKPPIRVGQRIGQGESIGSISGTGQLHLELYEAGTSDSVRWYGERPRYLLDPTSVMRGVLSGDRKAMGADARDDAAIDLQ